MRMTNATTTPAFSGSHSGTQLRFSSRPMGETFPRWHYDHKVYLSDHDWRVDVVGGNTETTKASTSSTRAGLGGYGNHSSARFLTTPHVSTSGRGASTKANSLRLSNKSEAADALEQYNFKVFKVNERKDNKVEEGSWWKGEQKISSNPYNVKRSKTINIHGESIYSALEKAAKEDVSTKEKDAEFIDHSKLFNLRQPPVKPRSAAEEKVIDKVRKKSFLGNAPSTYVDTKSTVIHNKDGDPIDHTGLGSKQNRPVWVSSTLLEDNLEHTSPGAMNALKYVEHRSRKFALAQSVAKLNHKMKKHHANRMNEQTLRPIKETISGLEKRQEDLERENQELHQLVKELAGVIEQHNSVSVRERKKSPQIKSPAKSRNSARAARAGSATTSSSDQQARSNEVRRMVPTSRRRPASKRPPFDVSPGLLMPSNAKANRRTEISSSASPLSRKQRSQWMQPRMTTKQRAMSERTQAFQKAMTFMSGNKGVGGGSNPKDVEKTLEAFARAQAEAELKLSDPSLNMSKDAGEEEESLAPKSLVAGLERRLQQVQASFSGDREGERENEKVIVVPTSHSGSQVLQKEKHLRSQSPGSGVKGAGKETGEYIDDDLREDLMKAVQSELQKQITGLADLEEGQKKKGKTSSFSAPYDIQMFMDDTNRKLEAISKQLVALQDMRHDQEQGPSETSKSERIVIVRPKQGRFDAGHSQNATNPSASPNKLEEKSNTVTFSAIKKNMSNNKTALLNSSLPKQLVFGSDGNLNLSVDRRIQLARLSDASIRDIEDCRERFMRQQRKDDEFVYANAASEDFNPVEIAETLTDMIIDDLLDDSAKELSEVCDSICENVFDQEFNDPGKV